MSEDQQTQPRVGLFRSAITTFIETRRDAKRKGSDDDPEAASKYEYGTWLADAARRVGQIQAVTHVLKATHPDARGSSLYVSPTALPRHNEIGSHLLGEDFAEDVVGNAAALDVFKFLKIEVDGRKLLAWMQADDADLKSALSDDEATASEWMSAFASLVRPNAAPTTHPMAKQVYWLVGDDPLDDAQYQLLQPLFSSTLAHAVHGDIQDARFGDANKEARQAFREKKPFKTPYRDYRNLVARKLGGTKPQNISQLNSERGGINYLLASLPPPAWQPSGMNLLKQESAFEGLIWFGGMRELVRVLSDFLGSDPDPTMPRHQHREMLEQAIAQEMAMFGAAVRGQYEPGWTRDPQCTLHLSQQLWLDPDRTELPVRDDPLHPQSSADDLEFNAAYQRGDWADEIAGAYGDWLNARLHAAGLVEVSHPERRHWAGTAIIDVAWPVPMKRRAAGGAG
ncbi:type I-F CRISPR-associated protein Csy1 [Dokdonella sp. MW10]|uniref:type I-F CRISPR-associated protein Csy1 n=1 Tax=Dokdonella sp. MW10 TaxID=2992926 RepID=UPI003F7FE16C